MIKPESHSITGQIPLVQPDVRYDELNRLTSATEGTERSATPMMM